MKKSSKEPEFPGSDISGLLIENLFNLRKGRELGEKYMLVSSFY